MWKAVLPGVIVLVTLGLSLVSGEVVKRESEQNQVVARAQTSEPEQSKPKLTPDVPASDAQAAAPQGRSARPVALVIGNAAYPDVGLPLAQPVNNARRLAEALKDKGFEVELGENLTKHGMEQAFDTFKSKIEPGSPALIFYSGFGIQAGRQTYMVPVNAQIWREADVRRDGVTLEPVLSEIEAKGAGTKLVILDASRRNPFERRFRGFSGGLAAIHGPDDTLVMSAAAPGKVVTDGEGELSPLTEELIGQIRASGESAEAVFNRTRVAVSRASHREQVPWVSSSLVQDFSFTAAEPATPEQHGAR
jgi:uncharacterized caspase-like protein